jgi:hypothetical protein
MSKESGLLHHSKFLVRYSIFALCLPLPASTLHISRQGLARMTTWSPSLEMVPVTR